MKGNQSMSLGNGVKKMIDDSIKNIFQNDKINYKFLESLQTYKFLNFLFFLSES